MTDILEDLAYLYGKPECKAKLKAQPEHFVVKEELGYSFTGSGEHLMVKIRKTGENTMFVANELARYCNVKSKNIGWAGLKDRHAVTEQWLSIHLAKAEQEPDFSEFEKQYPSIQILELNRHNKKLRPGDLIGNRFEITLSEVSDVESVEKRVESVISGGVPNYYGAQRFGRDGNNVLEAKRWGRDNVRTRNQNKRSMYLSTARSWIFNHIVSDRINQDCFSTLVPGDIVMLANETKLEESVMTEQKISSAITADELAQYQQKLESGEAFITAALAGDNALPTEQQALQLEQKIVDSEPDLMALIRGNRMRHDRRETLLKPTDLSYSVQDNNVVLCFSLSSGSFATSIIRELVQEIPVERSYE